MKHSKKHTATVTLFLLLTSLLISGFGVSASAQSLGDYARSVRKNKPETTSATRHYDNDNLPVNDTLSVVGPPPESRSASAPPPDANAAAADRQKTADDLQQKLDKQKQKIDALNHDLDLDQREIRLRTAAQYTDPTLAVRNVQWNKEDAQYKNDLETKQKALQDAKQQLDELQDQAHKAGIPDKEPDNNNKDKSSDSVKNNDNK